MREGFDNRREGDDGSEDVYSKAVRAGKRTYFFDVKATKGGDWYLTVTESRKKTARDGSATFEKNKIFLYKEDFAKFADGFDDAVGYVKRYKPEFFEQEAREAAGAVNVGAMSRAGAINGGDDIDAEFDRL